MKAKLKLICIPLLLFSLSALGQKTTKPASLIGRWDLDVDIFGQQSPAWLEVKHSGHKTLVGRVMFVFGSARPVSKINFENGKFSFSIPPQWDQGDEDILFEGELKDDKLKGTVTYVDKKVYNWTGVRAPSLKSNMNPEWDKPVKLFNGKDLQGWHASGDKNQWIVESGVLKSPKSGSNLITDRKFTDFKLHIEFRYPKNGNSGVYLRGR